MGEEGGFSHIPFPLQQCSDQDATAMFSGRQNGYDMEQKLFIWTLENGFKSAFWKVDFVILVPVSVWIYWAGVTCIDSNVGFKYLSSASCSLVLRYKTAVHSELLMQSGGHDTTVPNIKIKCNGNQTILSTGLCLSRAPRYIVQQDC